MGLIKESLRNTIKGKSRRINKALEDLDKSYYQLAKGFEGKYNQGITSRVGQKYDLDKVTEYLKGQRKLDTLPKEYYFSAKDINKQLDELRDLYLINHIDHNPFNNNLDNLERVSLIRNFEAAREHYAKDN